MSRHGFHPARLAWVVGDQPKGGVQDGRGRTVVFLQADGHKVRALSPQPGEDFRVAAAEAVDGLIRIPDDEELFAAPAPFPYQAVLERVDVLELVDEQVGETAALRRFLWQLFQEAQGFQQKVVIVQRSGLAEQLLIVFVYAWILSVSGLAVIIQAILLL